MNKKCLLQDLLLDFKSLSSLTDSQQQPFVNAFFSVITEGLIKDQQVKVKGLGTFKLVEVDKRSSVDVNTGERIEIEGHSKVSFIPENAIKSQINKPFEQFETVIINEGADLNVLENTESSPMEDDSLSALSSVLLKESKSSENTNETVEIHEEKEPIEQVGEDVSAEETIEDGCVKKRNWLKTIGWGIFLIASWGLSYSAGTYHLFDKQVVCEQEKKQNELSKSKALMTKEEKVKTEAKKEQKIERKQPIQISAKEKTLAKESEYPIEVGDKYRITGLKRKHILREGETLNKIAKEEYGSKTFTKYIIRYNDFKDPDLISVGSLIKLPLLESVTNF